MTGVPLSPDPEVLTLERIIPTEEHIVLEVIAHRPAALCPRCQQPSDHIHSHYQRIPQDLPWQGKAVQLMVHTRRFFCKNPNCPQRIFCERLNPALLRYARRTMRLRQALTQLGFSLGGEGGARLCTSLSMACSADTLLNIIGSDGPAEMPTPRVLGVDDFSFRRGKRFGTILVDLEQHRVVDLLPDRSKETFVMWLKTHPGVKVLSRDRSSDYALAAREAAPDAIQVADRWHLLKNLSEALECWLGRHRKHLTEEVKPDPKEVSERITSTWQLTPKQATALKTRREKCQAQFEKAAKMRQQGFNSEVIADEVGVSIRTLRRWSMLDSLPERKSPGGRRSILDPYKPYLEQRWQEGCEKARILWHEITSQGFRGSSSLVANYLIYLRNSVSEPHAKNGPPTPQLKRYLPKEACLLFTRPECDLNERDQARLKRLLEACPEATLSYNLAQRFTQMVRERNAEPFDAWLKETLSCGVAEMRRFANGVRLDEAAVKAALSLPYSNGQTEGQVNRLKLIKRAMYGRANFDLLRARVLHDQQVVSQPTAPVRLPPHQLTASSCAGKLTLPPLSC